MTAPYRTVLHRFYRSFKRHAMNRVSTLRGDDGTPIDVMLEDVSASGCRISGSPALVPHEAVMIGLAGLGARPARIVWSQDGRAGCRFDIALSAAEFERTQEGGTVITGAFPLTVAPTRPAALALTQEAGAEPRLQSRTRLAIICLAALTSWGMMAVALMIGWRIAT